MKNPKTNAVYNPLGFLISYDFSHDPDRNQEIIKPKSNLEFALDLAFPKRHLNKALNDLKKKMLASVEIPGSIAENKLERIKGNIMLSYAKELKRPVRFAKQGECQYTIELEREGRNALSPKPEDGLISTAKAAKILEVKASNLNAIRKAGKIKGKKIGGRFFFKPEEVERYRIQRAIDKL
jgi:hypothetical protein